MKKFILFLCLSTFPFTLKAASFWPEFKASYYWFASDELRDIYGSGAPLYQGELNCRLLDHMIIYGDGGYLTQKGRSINFHEHTRIRVIPWTVGAKFDCPFCFGTAYIGGGFRTYSIRIRNDSDYVERHVKRSHQGGVVNGGINFCCGQLIFNPFVEYNFIEMKFRGNREDIARNIYRHKLNLSGLSAGAGLALWF